MGGARLHRLREKLYKTSTVLLGGSPRIYAGEGAHFKIKHFSAGLKSISPLLKEGAPTKTLPTDVFRSGESRMQRRHATNHSPDCIVSRLWLVYKSVERRGLGKRRAAFLGIAGNAQRDIWRFQSNRIFAVQADAQHRGRCAESCRVRGQSGEMAIWAIGCYCPEAIALRKHHAMVFAAAAAAGRNPGFPGQQHGKSQSRIHQDKQ